MSDASLKPQIQEDMKTAMKARDSQRLGVIRLLMAAIKQREVDERITLNDTQILAVIDKMLKQRQDSATQFQSAGRQDLLDQENYEISVLQAYLPPALTEAEIDQLITQAINAVGGTSIKEMSKVMAEVKPKVQGRADMSLVSNKIKERLSN